MNVLDKEGAQELYGFVDYLRHSGDLTIETDRYVEIILEMVGDGKLVVRKATKGKESLFKNAPTYWISSVVKPRPARREVDGLYIKEGKGEKHD